ncbi:hypothetical protein M378DRAFT_172355 [Amanita muscaria Koide BX008]|uniref:Uncharacterized protein n=1 Tax=Amanita muscaria (strain Koide BX008) TaxID=946122 RepID=A0A0C2SS27_AMAMK|nr:hypothetical protein M378DRAFT_172355 [Amanita muscaria Koide BX008]
MTAQCLYSSAYASAELTEHTLSDTVESRMNCSIVSSANAGMRIVWKAETPNVTLYHLCAPMITAYSCLLAQAESPLGTSVVAAL